MRKILGAAAFAVAAAFCSAVPAAADDGSFHALYYLDQDHGWESFAYFHGEDDCKAVGEVGQEYEWWNNYYCQEHPVE
ncbi:MULTISPECIES: hypothetical protein [Actinokineospora]|uniref:Secreted protein n=1 Tax=Actinokineospora fastidiosa TaxID=1816 RepID=A0A918GLW3_9PSEU|nr:MULTISPECIES: hypothetical protein [Actinokineospora]UVS78763.1 hypothetical protein Actkin_02499 [Actinokineospora sp. UTMC 2448]GGS46860.1 hypothetical protein GCM10010171_47580 [Actinokineospora fastidiosa]